MNTPTEEPKTAYPLCWPEGWPRTSPGSREASRFCRPNSYAARLHSMDEARQFLFGELSRMGVERCILSTNTPLRIDGLPRSGLARPEDPGAAVYFKLNDNPVSLACDKWLRPEDNIWAIAKHIEALRGQERWGVGSIERAFAGYKALPGIGQSSGLNWWTTLGVPVNASSEQIHEAYRLLAKKHHPDKGGDPELFHRINDAYHLFKQTQNGSSNGQGS